MSTTHDLPSYESVMAGIESEIQGITDPKLMIEALSAQLTNDKITVIAQNADNTGIDQLTGEEKQAAAIGMAQTMTSDEADSEFDGSAQASVDAAKLCEQAFINLAPQLANIDGMNQPPPEGPFEFCSLRIQTYFEIMSDSVKLAANIATYARGFEDLVIPYCADNNFTVQERRDALGKWRFDANSLSTAALQMQTRFGTLQTDFGVFVGGFGNWAKGREGDLTKEIQDLDKELGDLQAKLTRINIALIAFGALTAAALPVTGVVAAMSGPAAPFVIVGGLIVAGVSLAITVGLVAGRISVQNEISNTTAKRDSKQKELEQIRLARQELIQLGGQSLTDLNDGLATLMSTWSSVQTDCAAIDSWLAQGAVFASLPQVIIAVQNGNTIYKRMAMYMDAYIAGINSASIKPPQYVGNAAMLLAMGRCHF